MGHLLGTTKRRKKPPLVPLVPAIDKEWDQLERALHHAQGAAEPEPRPAPHVTRPLWPLRDYLERTHGLTGADGWFAIDERTREPVRGYMAWSEGQNDYLQQSQRFAPIPLNLDWCAVADVGAVLVGELTAIATLRDRLHELDTARERLGQTIEAGLADGRAAWEAAAAEGEPAPGGEEAS